tara:strand:+ start:2198 stop:2416 length:219 start_codon:yes stop_codon:yes gene_type:complete
MKTLLTSPEVAKFLRINRVSLKPLREEQDMPFFKVGRKYLYDVDEILVWARDRGGCKPDQSFAANAEAETPS